MHDKQQTRAYKWEDSFSKWPGAHMRESAAKALIALACRKYKVPVPSVHIYKKNKGPSSYNPSNHSIRLRPRHLNAAIVLHESSHAIVDYMLGNGLEAHGPEWMGVYMVLLADFKIMPEAALHVTASEAGLRYRTRGWVGPLAIRRRYKKKRREARQDWYYWFLTK